MLLQDIIEFGINSTDEKIALEFFVSTINSSKSLQLGLLLKNKYV